MPDTPARLSPAARRDLLDIIGWIAKDNPASARVCRDTIAKALSNIGRFPNIGAERPELADEPYRFLPVSGFPYLIVYNPLRTPPLILRLIHSARNIPGVLRQTT